MAKQDNYKNIKVIIKCQRCKDDFDVYTKNPVLTKKTKKFCELCRVARARERAAFKKVGVL